MRITRPIALFIGLALVPATTFAEDGDAKAGAAVFRKCMACHTATEPSNRVGPSLMGVVGRPVASVQGYNYSPAMRAFAADGKVWNEEQLKAYLKDPKGVVKGTRMSFLGLKSEQDLDNVISYLKDPSAAR